MLVRLRTVVLDRPRCASGRDDTPADPPRTPLERVRELETALDVLSWIFEGVANRVLAVWWARGDVLRPSELAMLWGVPVERAREEILDRLDSVVATAYVVVPTFRARAAPDGAPWLDDPPMEIRDPAQIAIGFRRILR